MRAALDPPDRAIGSRRIGWLRRQSRFIEISLAAGLTLTACTTQLERGLSEQSADEIVLALAEHGIGSTKEADRGGSGFGVRVLESDVAGALSVLHDEDLPRAHGPSLAETFREPSLIPTAGEERARLAAALASDLERTIESLEGVHGAHVHIGLPDPSAVPIDESPEPRVASVLVESDAGATVDEAAVRSLVVGAVPGLSVEHVHVVAVVRPPPTTHAALTLVGPIAVSEGSAPILRGVLAGFLLVNVALAALLVRASRRRPAG